MKVLKYLPYIIPTAILILICIIMIASGAVNLTISGFAVDTLDRLYIGEHNQINVYQDGIEIYSISPRTSRAYEFTLKDNEIIIAHPSKVLHMDLNGNILRQYDDPSANTYQRLQRSGNRYQSAKGDIYEKVGVLGWTRIVKNQKETVYQISFLSFIVKLVLAIYIIGSFVLAIFLSIKIAGNRTRDGLREPS